MKEVSHAIPTGTVVRLFLTLICSLFFGEAIVVLVIAALPPFSPWGTALLDSTLLLVAVFPILYFLVFRPLALQIAERKRAEERLERSQAMLLRTEGIAHVGSWEWDVATDAVAWSDEMFRIFQLDPADVAPSFAEHNGLFPPEDMAQLNRAMEAAVSQGAPYELELHAIRADGTARVCLGRGHAEMAPGGKVIRLFGSFQDITERKQTEDAIRRSREEVENYLRIVESMILVLDAESRVVLINRKGCEIVGYGSEEITGKNWFDHFIPERLRAAMKDRCRRIMRGEESISTYFENPVLTRSGEERLVAWHDSLLKDQASSIIGTISSCEDITERKTHEARETLMARVLEAINRRGGVVGLIAEILRLVGESTGLEAVGIRLREGEDYPYYLANGFAPGFVEAERYLCERDQAGEIVRDALGHPVLECMCGNVIRGRFDPSKPFFTKRGSFWTNGTTQLLASTTEQGRQSRTRNRCNVEGYESVALIPLRAADEVIGLLQLNDHRPGAFTLEMIEFLEGLGASIGIALARQRAEEALRLDAIILQNVAEGIYLIGLEDGIIKYANPRFERMFGYDPGEMVGQYVAIVNAPTAKTPEETKAEIVGLLRETGEWHGEIENIKKDGTRFWCYANVSLFDHPSYGRVIISVHTDITEHKRAEAALRESEEELDRIFKLSSDLICVAKPDGYFDRVNPAWEKVLGYSIKEIMEAGYIGLIHPDDIKATMYEVQRQLSGVATINFCNRYRHKDGSYRFLEWQATPAEGGLLYATARDFTERKRAENKVRDSEERYRLLVEHSPDAICIQCEGRITFANGAALRLLGASRLDQIVGRAVLDFVHPEYRELVAKRMATIQKRRVAVPRREMKYVRLDGSLVDVEVIAVPITFEDRPAGQFIIHDITERKQTNAEIRRQKDRAQIYLNTAAVMMVAIGSDQKTLLVNKKACEVLGYEEKDILGKNWFNAFVPEEDRDRIKTGFNDLIAGKIKPWEYVENHLLTGSGQERLIAWHNVVLRDDESRIVATLSSGEDITERKQAEEALERSQAELKAIYEHAPVMMCVLDADRHVLYANRAFTAFTGVSEAELRSGRACGVFGCINALTDPRGCGFGDRCQDCQLRLALEDTLRTGIGHRDVEYCATLEHNGVRRNVVMLGATALVHADRRSEVLLCLRDITDRRQAEKTLRESEERFRVMFETHGAVMLLIEPQTGAIVEANAAAARFYGYSREHLRKLRIEDVNQLQPEQVVSERAAAVAQQRNYFIFPHRLASGEIRWVEVYSSPVSVEDQTLLFSIIHDVTERKQSEEMLQVHRQQLRVLASELSLAEERERRRIAMALHDHTCQSLVLARMKLDELAEAASGARAKAFHAISNTLDETIQGVRELTFDLSSPTLYRFGLEAALEELLEDKFGAEQGVEYGFSDDHEPKPLTEDVRVLLFQSVREVLINILKHAGAHKVSLDMGRTGGSIRIAVTDDGVGFDVDEVLSVPARHRGFGLFSIKERLDCIGGALEIDSQCGVGSRFTLVAPLKIEGHDSGRKHDVGQDSAR